MRRIFALVLGLMLLVVPAMVGAQDSKLVFDLDATFTVTDLGFQFKYPKDWVADTSRGIRLAENDTDLAAIVDTDETTQAEGYTISLNALTVDNLGMEPDAKLEDIVDALVSIAGITETEGRIEVPVLSRRAITIIGTNSSNKPGLASIWMQDGYVVLFNMGAPALNGDVGYSWGNILGGITALDALVMGKEPLDSPDGDFTMSYPEAWFTGGKGSGIAGELESDMTSSAPTPEGVATLIVERKLSELDKSVTDLDSLVEFLKSSQGWTEDTVITTSEHIVLKQPAITLSGENPTAEGQWAELTALVLDDKAVVIGAFFPTEDRFKEFQPTYLSMLTSINATEAAAS